MWLEVETKYIPEWERGEADSPLKVIEQKPLSQGDEVVLFRKKTPITRRTKAMAYVTPLDEDRAEITFNGEGEFPVNAGIVGEFTYQIAPEHARDGMVVTKQDVVVWGRNDTIRGVLWVNENGERLHPRYMHHGRSFYEGDSDPEALKLFQRLEEEERSRAEGKLVYENLMSVDGMSLGIEYELLQEKDTPVIS